MFNNKYTNLRDALTIERFHREYSSSENRLYWFCTTLRKKKKKKKKKKRNAIHDYVQLIIRSRLGLIIGSLTIFQLYHAVSFISVGNHRPVASH